ncbi:MAG TPA: ferrous iron transport protein B [Anaerolineales bacterium]|nr:ferrous iron transport protein B [Anaerolineales bacterium]
MSVALFRLDYGSDLETEIARLEAAFVSHGFDPHPAPARWLALKLLEGERDVIATVVDRPNAAPVLALARERAEHLRGIYGEDVDLMAADRRFGYVSGVTRQVVQRAALNRFDLTRRIDDVLTHRWLGLPIFFAVMYVVFRLVIDVSAPFLEWVDGVINGPIAHATGSLLTLISAPDWVRALLVDGIIGGVGGVLTFVPGLMMLFFFLALLEDSGYLARAAFVMDRFMRVVGLHGKSFIPMVLGIGCAVPAIYATRTLSSRRDRILTALLTPLMSCSARLPVYVVFGLALFGSQAGTVIWLMYALGIVVALLAGSVFTRTLLKPDQTSAFVLELPPYRRPTARGLLIHMWENVSEFVSKAGTVILGASLALWLMLNLPWGVADQRDSYYGQIAHSISPVFAPLGFGDWQTSGALISGFAAKEVVVSTFSQVFVGGAEEDPASLPTPAEELWGVFTGFGQAAVDASRTLLSIIPGVDLLGGAAEPEDTALSAALRNHYTPLAAFSLLVFVLLYVPCMATLGALKHEFGWRWAVVSAVYQTGLAWVASLLIYQGGLLFGLG